MEVERGGELRRGKEEMRREWRRGEGKRGERGIEGVERGGG